MTVPRRAMARNFSRSRRSNSIERVARPFPYMIPGTFPRESSFRAPSFPDPVRRTAVNSIMAISLSSRYTKSELTESLKWIRLMASPRRFATERTRIFLHAAFSPRGIVLVTASCSISDFSSRSIAGPERTGWGARANTCFAPSRRPAAPPWTSVPAVSTMSSRRTAVFPSTSPMMFITRDSLVPARRLSMIAIVAFSRLAKARAPPPRVGGNEHDIVFPVGLDELEHHGGGVEVVDRDVEEPLDLPGVQIHREYTRNPRRRQKVRHEFGGDRGTGEHLPALPRIPVIRDDRRDPLGGGALQGVHQDQEFDQVVVHRGAGRAPN